MPGSFGLQQLKRVRLSDQARNIGALSRPDGRVRVPFGAHQDDVGEEVEHGRSLGEAAARVKRHLIKQPTHAPLLGRPLHRLAEQTRNAQHAHAPRHPHPLGRLDAIGDRQRFQGTRGMLGVSPHEPLCRNIQLWCCDL